MRPDVHTAIHLYDIGNPDDCIQGLVVIHGRITPDTALVLQEFMREKKPDDSEHAEILARKWLEEHGYNPIYPLYWEQVWCQR
jgi:hypothetical protein